MTYSSKPWVKVSQVVEACEEGLSSQLGSVAAP